VKIWTEWVMKCYILCHFSIPNHVCVTAPDPAPVPTKRCGSLRLRLRFRNAETDEWEGWEGSAVRIWSDSALSADLVWQACGMQYCLLTPHFLRSTVASEVQNFLITANTTNLTFVFHFDEAVSKLFCIFELWEFICMHNYKMELARKLLIL
jgi:hypothetical protein